MLQETVWPKKLTLGIDMELDARRIEQVFGIPERDWQKILRRNLESGVQADGESLALFGYGELQNVSFFLTTDGLRLWRNDGGIEFPDACCVCQRSPSIWLSSKETDGKFHDGRRPVRLTRVPHCSEHGSARFAKLLFDAGSLSANVVWVALVGQNANFLRDTLARNRHGDVPPPWIAFPDQNSYSGYWRQSGEPWITTVFFPFWAGLDSNARFEYLERWSAPADWREWLALLNEQNRISGPK
jgi:hypothetical protein